MKIRQNLFVDWIKEIYGDTQARQAQDALKDVEFVEGPTETRYRLSQLFKWREPFVGAESGVARTNSH